MNKKDYKKLIQEKLSGFLEAHHVDIHERLDIVEKALVRIEIKLDRLNDRYVLDEPYELDENFNIMDSMFGEDEITNREYNEEVSLSQPENFDILGEK